MAADLTRRRKTEGRGQTRAAAAPPLFARVTLFCLLSSVICPLAAQNWTDPTQPPAGIYGGQGDQGAANVIRPRANNGLQSVIISPQRRAAIINGETVELGAKIGGAKLIEVNEGGVVLQGIRGKRMLALFPGVSLKMKTDSTAQSGQENTKSENEADHAVTKEKR